MYQSQFKGSCEHVQNSFVQRLDRESAWKISLVNDKLYFLCGVGVPQSVTLVINIFRTGFFGILPQFWKF